MTKTAEWRDGWYVVPYEVEWRDLDALGHVNNAVYFAYFESARTRYWLDLREVDEPGPGSIGFIVAHARCDFRRQIGLLECIDLKVRIGEMRNSSFDFDCEIARKSGEIAATGRVVCVLYDWERNSKVPIDEALRRRIRVFQQEEGGK